MQKFVKMHLLSVQKDCTQNVAQSGFKYIVKCLKMAAEQCTALRCCIYLVW